MSMPPSHLFLTRLWKEPRSDDKKRVRIQVRHVLSGETCNFSQWSDVVDYLIGKLEELSGPAEEQEKDS